MSAALAAGGVQTCGLGARPSGRHESSGRRCGSAVRRPTTVGSRFFPLAAGQVTGPTAADAAEMTTWRWLDTVIIGLDLCPFAQAARPATRVVVASIDAPDAVGRDAASAAAAVLAEARLLVARPVDNEATTLVVLPPPWPFGRLSAFVAALDASRAALAAEGLAATLQLVPFHPAAQYERKMATDAASYVGRAPFPTIHLLRESDVARAERMWTRRHGPGRAVSEVGAANEGKLRALGIGRLAGLFSACFRDDS